ncbi:hypothetical protein FACS1894207_3020 [Bacteroidia bacterium]|nr:hypothetical protein FACS1894207_3020 [Bacteroidia bacterium]
MKRKLFTLLFALAALASFQVSAQTKFLIWAGDTSSVSTGTNYGIPGPTGSFTTARNYAQVGGLAWPGKLTKDWKWVKDAPVNTDDKFYLNQDVGANFTRFIYVVKEGGQTVRKDSLELTYNGVKYDKFVIFRGTGTGALSFAIDPAWPGTNPTNPQGEDILHAGYLSINTASAVTDDKLVIVLVEKGTGKLALNTVEFLRANLTKYAPFAFYAFQPQGHWATPADFPCKYNTFPGLYVIKADTTRNRIFTTDTVRTFAVTQVDWVAKNDDNQSLENIFGNRSEAGHYYPAFDSLTVAGRAIGGGKRGLQFGVNLPAPASAVDSIIPLFTLSAPELGCGVVSVSRQNTLDIQSQGDGVYANKLEIRDYGHYYDYKQNAQGVWVYEEHTASIAHNWDWTHDGDDTKSSIREDRVATSLQKFAFWIDEDGVYTMYPAASYSWKYGNPKPGQQSIVYPNSVLLYNNIDITQTTGGVSGSDKGWGVKIGTWNGRTTANPSPIGDAKIITTIPNVLDINTDYTDYTFKPDCGNATLGDISGRFFFLDVLNPGVNGTGTTFANATKKNAYQSLDSTQYVLSTQTQTVGGVTTKHLVVLPKEKVRGYKDNNNKFWYNDLLQYKQIEGGKLLPEYYLENPYDSVNMAAHWEIINKGTATDPVYLLINMLGDTLQYNTNGNLQDIAGGYLPVNEEIATSWRFSRDGGDALWWFAQNPELIGATTKSLWKASAIPGAEKGSFVLSLVGSDSILSVKTGPWYQNGRHAKGDSIYFQQDVNLEKSATVFPWTDMLNLDCTGGLILKKSPIYYVPNYSGSYAEERGDTINPLDPWRTINTNDNSFVDGRVKQDSLTAYLQLHGEYGIREANDIANKLFLGEIKTEYGANAAVLTESGAKNVKFIPLSETERTAQIRKSIPYVLSNGLIAFTSDTLFAETYKWFVVQLGDQYLVFDTIAPNALEETQRVALTWRTTDVANATPVRLYQPLVGDKLQGNFIFQFYVPNNTYSNARPQDSRPNVWPAGIRTGELHFGRLSSQSKYIFAEIDKKYGTRFTYELKGTVPNPCNCPEQFIAPDWMADNKLLSLPVKDQIWDLTKGTGFGFATGRNNEATAAQGISELKHIFVDSIKPFNTGTAWEGRYTYGYGTGTATRIVNSFLGEVAVPLYYIQNSKGEYLTVGESTYQFDSRSTTSDVTGVNLIWRKDLYPTNSDATKNQRALQLFAISGAQSTPNTDGWYAGCQSYVYLPLASYKVDYKTGTVDKTVIFYNNNLGKRGTSNCETGAPVNDVTSAFRVSQYSPISDNQKTLIVANSTTTGGIITSVVPVELKWQKNTYQVIGCNNYQLVKNVKGNFYYAAGGDAYDTLCQAGTNTLLAHWKITHDAADEQIHYFTPESVLGYGKDLTKDNKQLTGKYYVFDKVENGNTTKARVLDFSKYNSQNKYAVLEDTFEITCVEHTLPFANLEADEWGYNLPDQLAIIEAPFLDRNLTDYADIPTVLINDSSYQVYLNQIGGDIKSATYLSTYKTNVRQIGDAGHIIPYYSFSLTRNGKEYFLNVRTAAMTGAKDSVYWTEITAADRQTIIDDYANGIPNAGSNALKLFKFCLPYQLNSDGERAEAVLYGEKGKEVPYYRVYIQTLDVDQTDYPYLVVAGSSTRYVTARNLKDAILNQNTSCAYANGLDYLAWNIYSVDYTQIDSTQVTSWIFGGEQPGDHQWVPLQQVHTAGEINPTTVDGLLTNFRLQQGGHAFVSESKESPVNYGVLLGKTPLHFEYQGTEQIGSYWKVPIYYYRIQVPAPGTEGWLTDSYGKTGNYIYTWGPTAGIQNDYQLAYFDNTKLTDNVTGKTYDKQYVQTFGFLYYGGTPESKGDYTLPDQTFVVVSNANYQSPKPAEYRYLAEVNGHLVFVEGIENALLFQFGKEDANGNYTGIEVVGQAGVVGVQGGVKLLNQTGTVSIYSIDGSLIKSVQVTGADQTIAVPRGIVVVKIDGKATKVVVK